MATQSFYSDIQVFGEISSEKITITGQYSLPLTDGTAGQVLMSDGSGNVNFQTITGFLTTSSILNGTGINWSVVSPGVVQGNVTLAPFSTANLTEGSNLYFTNERVDDRVATLIKTGLVGTGANSIAWTYNDAAGTLTPTVSLTPFSTSNLAEGSNLYFTDERVDDRVANLIKTGLAGTGPNSIVWSYNDATGALTPTVSLAPFSTSNLAEGSNLYFTNERVDDRVAALIQDSATVTWTYNDGLGTLTATAISGVSSINVEEDGSPIGTRDTIDFITGTATILTVTDDLLNSKVTVQYDVDLNALPDPVILADSGTGSSVRKDNCNAATGDYSTVSGGQCNTASCNGSTVGGGYGNTSSNYYSAISGGQFNIASSYYSTVNGGYFNTASSYYSIVSGGRSNTASGYSSTVGGGDNNIASGNCSTVSGGYDNTASGSCSTASGGVSNTASGNYSTVSGGYCNTSDGQFSTVGGGRCNFLDSNYSTISGGYNNSNSAASTGIVISGGVGNCIDTGCYSAISGGYQNTILGEYAVIGGGNSNCSVNSGDTIGGGICNTAGSASSLYFSDSVLGGYCNAAVGGGSFVGGGYYNTSSGLTSSVPGGYCNTASGNYSIIGGGSCNDAVGCYSSILGGSGNTASCNFSGIFGCNITSVCDNTFHVNNLNLYGTPTADRCNTAVLVRGNNGMVNYKAVGALFVQTANSSTVTATVTETTIIGSGLGTLTVGANQFSVGDAFRVRLGGVFSMGNNETIQIKMKTGAVVLADTGALSISTTTNKAWDLIVDFTVRAIGAAPAGEILSHGVFTHKDNNVTDYRGQVFNTLETTTFDTTVSNTLDVTVTFGSTSANNSIYSTSLILEKIF